MTFQEFKAKYQKVEVEHFPTQVMEKPLLSICVQTFRHARFIKECLDSLLMQQTSFPYEILLGEDGSTDGTREICEEYARQYPEKICLFLHQRENNIKMDGKPTGRFNFMYNLYQARGAYIAFCEGDDYWTDPQKLQKQVDFLEANTDCSLCFHPTLMIFEDGSRPDMLCGPGKVLNRKEHRFSPAEVIAEDLGMWTASMVFRSEILNDLPDWFASVRHADAAIKFFCVNKGVVGYVGGNPMAAYRRGVAGAWSDGEGKDRQWEEDRLRNHLQVLDLFNEFTHQRFNGAIQHQKKRIIREYLKAIQEYGSRWQTLKAWKKYPLTALDLSERATLVMWLRFVLGKEGFEKMRTSKNY